MSWNNYYNDQDVADALTPQLGTIFQNDVEYDGYEAKENVRFMQDAISGLIRVMKEMDPLFSEVYRKIVHAGSYYEGLRITSADEFDLQLVLEFPFPTDSFMIAPHRADSPFVTYRLKQDPKQELYRNMKWTRPYKKLASFFDDNGYLLADEVLRWIHSLLEKAFDSDQFTVPRTVNEIVRKEQPSTCPAFTLEITGESSGRTIDVDLVGVLDISSAKLPRKMYKSKRFRQLLENGETEQWFLVPKPSKNKQPSDPMSQVLWRNTFPAAEKQLLNETGCLKDMIMIFKRLRDVNGNWRKPIYSYVLKSFFMRKFDKDPDLEYWSDDNLGQVFLESLEQFQEAMERCYIPDYFNPKSNMIAEINSNAAMNIAGRVRNIISELKEDPDSLQEFFPLAE